MKTIKEFEELLDNYNLVWIPRMEFVKLESEAGIHALELYTDEIYITAGNGDHEAIKEAVAKYQFNITEPGKYDVTILCKVHDEGAEGDGIWLEIIDIEIEPVYQKPPADDDGLPF